MMHTAVSPAANPVRPADRGAYLASLLVPYACAHGWDGPRLAAELGCPLAALPRLLLCLRPRPERYERDVAKVAAYVGLDGQRLVALLHAAEQLPAA
jgi:hypothetical protein